jgi:hypothetical protein
MSIRSHLEQVQLVKVGPSLREHIGRRITAKRPNDVVGQLQRFREKLDRDMMLEPWTNLDGPVVLVLADICDALGLSERDRAAVLGSDGEQTLVRLVHMRRVPVVLLNERQAKALRHAQEYGVVSLSAYRSLCPGWSDETLRPDVGDLVERGLPVKNGSRKGANYTPVV